MRHIYDAKCTNQWFPRRSRSELLIAHFRVSGRDELGRVASGRPEQRPGGEYRGGRVGLPADWPLVFSINSACAAMGVIACGRIP